MSLRYAMVCIPCGSPTDPLQFLNADEVREHLASTTCTYVTRVLIDGGE